MAVIETWIPCDLQKPVQVQSLCGSLFSNNGNGNRIGAVVTDNGEAVTLSGTVSGYAVLSDGTTVPCTGSLSGNKASVLIPAAAYLPGNIFITVFLTSGTTVTTLAAVSATVVQARTDSQVDPGSVVTDWTNIINAALQNVEAFAGNMIATPYASLTFPVPLGKLTIYNDYLYRCKTPISSSEAWTASHWEQTTVADEIAEEITNRTNDVDALKSTLNIETINDNILCYGNITYGYAIYSNGNLIVNNNYNTTDYIPVSEGDIIYGNVPSRCAWYDSNKVCVLSDTFSSYGRIAKDSPVCVYPIRRAVVPSGVAFFRICIEKTIFDKAFLKKKDAFTVVRDDFLSTGNLLNLVAKNDGEVITQSGGVSNNENYSRTDFISVEAGDIIFSNEGARYAFYDSTKAFISGKTGIMSSQKTLPGTGYYFVKAPENAKFFRVCYENSVLETIFFGKTTKYDLETNYNIAKLKEASGIGENYWKYGDVLLGYALNAGSGQATANENYNTTDYIPVTPGDILYTNNGLRSWFYDSSKVKKNTFVFTSQPEILMGVYAVTVPDGAAYFRTCVNVADYAVAYIKKASEYDRYLKGLIGSSIVVTRKLYCLGDSITRGMYAEQGASSSSGPTDKGYPYWIGQINGYDVVNLGVSGSGYANMGGNNSQESGTINSKVVVDENSFSDADIITLAFGVNDWKGAEQDIHLGDMTSTSGDGTVIGNMKYCIEQIVTKKPTAQIIVLLPLNTNRQWSGMETMTFEDNWAFGYAYRYNQTLQDYRNAIKTCADYYNIKVVDLEEVCPINRLNIRYVCGDGLHPTTAFYKQMGLALAKLIC